MTHLHSASFLARLETELLKFDRHAIITIFWQ